MVWVFFGVLWFALLWFGLRNSVVLHVNQSLTSILTCCLFQLMNKISWFQILFFCVLSLRLTEATGTVPPCVININNSSLNNCIIGNNNSLCCRVSQMGVVNGKSSTKWERVMICKAYCLPLRYPNLRGTYQLL